jgi:membrane protein YqaA with SNARE-associated domain
MVSTHDAAIRPSPVRRLYDWLLGLSGSRHAIWALAAVSFAESSVFPIPPDILLIPMVLAARDKAFLYAFVCTASSVVGGFLGYAIGWLLFDTVGRQIFTMYGLWDAYEGLKHQFDTYGSWAIIIKGATPIPYKLLTIASGMAQFDLLQFTVASVISRSFRFFLVAALLWKYGEPIRTFVEGRLTLLLTLFVILLVGGFVALKFLF